MKRIIFLTLAVIVGFSGANLEAAEQVETSSDQVPAADLILCRHLLIHLSFGQGLAALENFRRTGARYLLVTTNPSLQENREIVHTGSFRPVNMERAPFVLPRPLEVLPDPQGPDDPTVLGLYRLNS